MASSLVAALHRALADLQSNPYPYVSNPPGCTKRASVAIIIRVRPAYAPLPHPPDPLIRLSQDATSSSLSSSGSSSCPSPPPQTLDAFFSQPWVRGGDPEILFIKRAGRASDRWSGHVALPGGHRDPGDASDLAAAMRETREEVGLDLDLGLGHGTANCIAAGNLPERVVTTTWGRAALMVLCPYVFVLTDQDGRQRLRPQPAEVAAAHWVPLRALLSPALRTREYVDAASRMARRQGRLACALLRLLVGRMVFSAVQLVPSESVYATSAEGFLLPDRQPDGTWGPMGWGKLALAAVLGARHVPAPPQPLLMWGLTLGVLADLLDMLPPYTAVSLWQYPTFTPPDLRFLIWLFTLEVRKRGAAELEAGRSAHAGVPSRGPDGGLLLSGRRRRPSQTAMDATVHAVAVTEAEPSRLVEALKDRQAVEAFQNQAGVDSLGVRRSRKKEREGSQDVVSRLLSGYHDKMNLAMAVFAVYRIVMGCGIAYRLFLVWQKRRGG